LFLAGSVLVLTEYLLPKSRNSFISRVRGAIFGVAAIAVSALAIILFNRLWRWVGVKPLFTIDLSVLSRSRFSALAALGGILASLVVILAYDFFYYWFHRLQHSNKFLWRFHSEHHAVEELNAINAVHHVTDEFFRIPFILVPLSLLFSFKQGYVPWIWSMLIGWQTLFIHSSTRLNLGWFRYILIDNRFHRIHHSKERKHFDKNFGGVTATWDIIFGTAHYPRSHEWPDVGLDQMKQATNFRQFLFRAFRKGDASLLDTSRGAGAHQEIKVALTPS
jgi:sterol desaturase/sphingolipid hydroxylase (fatty acid hydroxylase superfamily)